MTHCIVLMSTELALSFYSGSRFMRCQAICRLVGGTCLLFSLAFEYSCIIGEWVVVTGLSALFLLEKQ